MFKHDLEKNGSVVSKHSENIKDFGFSAKNLAKNPKKLEGFKPQDPQLFGCMISRYDHAVRSTHTWKSWEQIEETHYFSICSQIFGLYIPGRLH